MKAKKLRVPVVPRCPACGATLDAVRGQGRPKEGDWNVCAYCLAPLRFRQDLTSRRATIEELEQDVAAGQISPPQAALLRQCFAGSADRGLPRGRGPLAPARRDRAARSAALRPG